MGFVQSKVLKRPKKYRARILMLGLDSTGKTTLLYNMITGEELSTIPTMGFNVEELSHPNKKFTLDIWDIGGQKSIRRLWRHYYLGAQIHQTVIAWIWQEVSSEGLSTGGEWKNAPPF
ncbi:unnamed protein product [Oikopleura dioica]|uniref:Uncharacterized protein n=1 Tax=Oikopleura dioica TaxID=34765 RepID=E4XDT4_OIKDI|nr:unnamed protein product [Oikopleura dioica]